jgi:hypothetical protein
MNELDKDPSASLAGVNAIRAAEGSHDHCHTPQKGKGFVLTNQCLGKERMLSVLLNSEILIVVRHRVYLRLWYHRHQSRPRVQAFKFQLEVGSSEQRFSPTTSSTDSDVSPCPHASTEVPVSPGP